MLQYIEKYFWLIVVSFLFLILIVESFLVFSSKEQNIEEDTFQDTVAVNTNEENKMDELWIEIKGAVKNPGIYKVASNSIINDVINLANGFKTDAYTDNLNLSQKVTKQMVLNIYTKNEYKKFENAKPYEKCYVPSYDITSCLNQGFSVIITDSSKSATVITKTDENKESSTTNIVNINTADKNMLTSLTGIGDAKAEKIISYRDTVGLFKTIEDIKKVSGIGDALFNQIKNNITV